MVEIFVRNISRFLFLALIQGLIMNNILLTPLHISPFFYVLFILLLPFETPGWLLLVLSFFIGWSVDLFSNTFGIHAAACVAMAFLRPLILELNSPRDGYESGTFPRVSYYGLAWFFKYALLLIFIHHILYFFIEAFSFKNILITFGRIALSTILTTFLVVPSQYLIYRN